MWAQGWVPLSNRGKKDSDGSAELDLLFGPVKAGEAWRVTWLAAKDNTADFTRVEFILKRGGTLEPRGDNDAPIAQRLYFTDSPFWVWEGEEVGARFSGTANGDDLEAYIEGEIHKKGQGG